MSALVWLFVNWRGVLAGAALASIVAFPAGYIQGRAADRNSQLRDTVKAHETRNEIDDSVARRGDADLCLRLGGMPDDCNKLRGMEAPSGGK